MHFSPNIHTLHTRPFLFISTPTETNTLAQIHPLGIFNNRISTFSYIFVIERKNPSDGSLFFRLCQYKERKKKRNVQVFGARDAEKIAKEQKKK